LACWSSVISTRPVRLLKLAGSSVVTSMSNGARSSATRCQTSMMAARSASLNVVRSPSWLKASALKVPAPQAVPVKLWPLKSR
jgi:hypothetical protein